MSITTIDQPSNAIESAYTQIVYGMQSDRDGALAYTVTAVANNTFKAEFSVGLHAIAAGDTVTMSGFTTTSYNGTFDVLETSAGTITCDVAFVINDTGTATLSNNNFSLSCKAGLVGVNTLYSISAIDTPTSPSVGVNLVRLVRTDIPIADVQTGDLINITSAASADAKRVWEAQDVYLDSGDTVIEIQINLTDTITTSTGSIEVLGELSGGYPEKFSDGILIGSQERYRFNISNILQSILSGDLAPLGTANIVNALSGIKEIGIVFTEWHDDADGFREDYETLSVLGVEYVDSIFQHTDTGDITDYYLDNPTTGLFMTNAPDQDIRVGEEVQLSFLTPNETDIEVRYETFDLSGSSNGEASLGAVIVSSNKAIATINSNIITSLISRADVWIVRTSDTAQFSEKKTFNVISGCTNEAKRFWFRNPRGGYDCYTFTKGFESPYKTSYDEFTTPLPFEFDVSDRGGKVAQANNKFENSISTDFVRFEVRSWLIDLLDSNDVYIEENGVLVPILLKKGTNVINSEDMISIGIKYTFANRQITKIN